MAAPRAATMLTVSSLLCLFLFCGVACTNSGGPIAHREEAVSLKFPGFPAVTGIPVAQHKILTVAHGLPDKPIDTHAWFDNAFVGYELVTDGGKFDYLQKPGEGEVVNDWAILAVQTKLSPVQCDFTTRLEDDQQIVVVQSLPGELPGEGPRKRALNTIVMAKPPNWHLAPGIYLYGSYTESCRGFSGAPVYSAVNGQTVVVGMAAGEITTKDKNGNTRYVPFFIRPPLK